MTKRHPLDTDWDRMPDVGLEKWPDYDTDTAAWAEHQAAALHGRRVDSLDWDHLADEILDVARSERRELEYRVSAVLATLARQLLGANAPGDARLLCEQRALVLMQMSTCPSLSRWLKEPTWLARCWAESVVSLGVLDLRVSDLPEECPFGQNDLLQSE